MTTRPYPVDITDPLDSHAAQDEDVRAQRTIPPDDMIDAFADIGSMTLHDILREYGYIESLDPSADIESLTLRDLLHETSYEESIDPAADIHAMTLTTVMVEYTRWPMESIDPAAHIRTMTLT